MDIYVYINGVRKSLRQLSAESGVAYETIYARWKNGVPADQLVPKTEAPEQPVPEITAASIQTALGYAPGRVNPNLLDNWYFANPVNQRGQTAYNGAGYGIDRWKMTASAGSIVINDGYLSFSAETGSAWLIQPMEIPVTGTLTLSALAKSSSVDGALSLRTNGSGTVLKQTTIPMVSDYKLVALTVDVEASSIVNNSLTAVFSGTVGASIDILAAKLELGDTQTLAHQDENGNWVLNEIPNYAEQLARCQRYYVKFENYITSGFVTSSAKNYHIPITLPVPMRTIPVVTMESYLARKSDGYSVRTGSAFTAPVSLAVSGGYSAVESGFIDIIDTVSAAVDGNNIVRNYTVKNLVLKAEL